LRGNAAGRYGGSVQAGGVNHPYTARCNDAPHEFRAGRAIGWALALPLIARERTASSLIEFRSVVDARALGD
jgi:hypothetical protein